MTRSSQNRGNGTPTLKRQRVLIVVMIVLGTSFVGLAYYGFSSLAYVSSPNYIVTKSAFDPIPVPYLNNRYTNRALTPNQTIELRLIINYQAGTQVPIVDGINGVLRFTMTPSENGVTRWQIPYIYFGFYTNDSGQIFPPNTWLRGTFNFTVYDPIGYVLMKGTISPEEYFGIAGSASAPFMTIYEYNESAAEGEYVFMATNSGQTVLNGTYIIGYSRITMEKPLFTVGVAALVSSGVLAIATSILYIYYSKRRPLA